jgi:hypothetical protein
VSKAELDSDDVKNRCRWLPTATPRGTCVILPLLKALICSPRMRVLARQSSIKYAALLMLMCATCIGQDAAVSASCPVQASVAGTNIPLLSGEHIVIWFQNQSSKTVLRSHFEVALIDGANSRYPASGNYVADSPVNANQAGVVIEPAQNEAKHLGQGWRSIRGMEVRVTEVLFTDGSRWQSPGRTTCKHSFLNANYEHDMRAWNAALRADWNRRHPDQPMPEPALAAWLLPYSEGWR